MREMICVPRQQSLNIRQSHCTGWGSGQDPTTTYVKQIQRALKDCPDIIDKHKIKHLTPIHPVPPTLTARLKIHKPNISIRPVVNNINAPSYKVARFMAKSLKDYLNLPNTYNTINSHALAQDISKLTINEHCKLVTYDIKDLYVNIPIDETLHITDFFLRINNNKATIRSQILGLMQTTLAQNYFKFNKEFYQAQKGIAMGSPLSGLVAELFLQYFELHIVKHSLETKSIIFYTRYVDDILIIYNESLTNKRKITTPQAASPAYVACVTRWLLLVTYGTMEHDVVKANLSHYIPSRPVTPVIIMMKREQSSKLL
ncbi:hypothetical protein Cfor_03532 [Coptotermes formosanus]|uniref:Reverse transcriptase domain-containing protein n=1 Tax=Coptotermes formosanus TaxID=36987 RepID=A0A6L2PM99_COPFO|nr:hypothetical protein Cfor_03532 [Coptotermes formosanus]